MSPGSRPSRARRRPTVPGPFPRRRRRRPRPRSAAPAVGETPGRRSPSRRRLGNLVRPERRDSDPVPEIPEPFRGPPLSAIALEQRAHGGAQATAWHQVRVRHAQPRAQDRATDEDRVLVQRATNEREVGRVRSGAAVGAPGHAHGHPDVGQPQALELPLQLVDHSGEGPLRLGDRQATGRHRGAGHRPTPHPRDGPFRGHTAGREDRLDGRPPAARHVRDLHRRGGRQRAAESLLHLSPEPVEALLVQEILEAGAPTVAAVAVIPLHRDYRLSHLDDRFGGREAVVEVAEAVVTVQRDYGNRGDRRRARLKYLLDEQGLDWFRRQVEQRLGRALPPPAPVEVTDVPGGWRAAVEAILTTCGVPAEGAISRVRRWSMACPAMPTCGLAIAEAERALPGVIDELERELERLGLADVRMTVRMTGCPNGCARPYTADLAFVGRALDKYTIFVGGTILGTRLGVAYADLVQIGRAHV